MEITIENLKNYRESENKIEFKKGENGNISYNGADKQKPKDRRRSILGYVTALCNEKGGALVIGMSDQYPHKVVGTKQCINGIGKLESDIYRDTRIRVSVRELYDEDKRVLVIEIPSRPSGVFCKPQILKIAKKNPHPHLGKFSLWRLSFSPCCLNHRRAGCNYGAQVCLS